jgi:hypothetical protein
MKSSPLYSVALLWVILGCLNACGFIITSTSPAPPYTTGAANSPSTPFFDIDPQEAKVLHAFFREQDGRLTSCAQDHSCDRVHFTSALIALYDNQRVAIKHFQDVIAIAPKSHLATLSAAWLNLLRQAPSEPRQDGILAQTTQWVLRDLLHREQTLRQELNTRNQKLEEMSGQLEALKQIDLEMKEKSQQMKPGIKALPESEKTP